MPGWTARSSVSGGYHGYCLTAVIVMSVIWWFSYKLAEWRSAVSLTQSSSKACATRLFPVGDLQWTPISHVCFNAIMQEQFIVALSLHLFPIDLIRAHLINWPFSFSCRYNLCLYVREGERVNWSERSHLHGRLLILFKVQVKSFCMYMFECVYDWCVYVHNVCIIAMAWFAWELCMCVYNVSVGAAWIHVRQQEKQFLSVLPTDYSLKVNKNRILSLVYLILF